MSFIYVNIGTGNVILANKIVGVFSPDSAPIKKLIKEAREKGKLIDATGGKRTRSVIISESRHVILSAIQPRTLTKLVTKSWPERMFDPLNCASK